MGYVGRALERFFRRAPENELCVYDKFISGVDSHSHQDSLNNAELVFVAVPTPTASDGSCDTIQVEDAAQWITSPICIKSTIIPGTVDRLAAITGRRIAFSPEYIGESESHPWTEVDSCGFLIVGGHDDVSHLVIQAYKQCERVHLRVHKTSARAAELCKYMENAFLATKVTFVNQFFDIADSLGVDFDELRQLWLLDGRVGESHTRVTPERGFSGRCLPKDLLAMISAMRGHGGAPLLEAIFSYNEVLNRPNSERYMYSAAERDFDGASENAL
jgi:nucleotide sugar dehydrogenase